MRRHTWTVIGVLFVVLLSACGARFKQGATDNGGLGQSVSAGSQGTDLTSGGSDNGGSATGSGSSAGVSGVSGGSGGGASAGSSAAGGASGPALPSGTADPGPAPGVTATSIKIGYLLPLTGAAPVPTDFSTGVNVYYNDVNAKGGVNGRKIQVVIEDTQSDAQVGKDKAKKLIEQDKVFEIVALDRLENQQAIGEYLNSRHFPNIAIQTPANLASDQSWTFGVTIDHAVQGKLIADYFIRVLHATKAAVVYENTPALYPGRDAFTKEIQALGGSVVYSKSIDGQANDYSGEALGLKQAGATATWLYMAPTPAAKLANQSQAAGYHPTWFANSISWGFDLALKVGPTALAGSRAFSPWLPVSDPRTAAYQNAYRQQNPNSTPDDIGLIGWGVGEIVTAGLRAAGQNLGQNALRDALQHLNFRPDVWAPITFGPGVREGANVIAVLKESGGHWVLEHDFTSSF